jgi:hypothetical protein
LKQAHSKRTTGRFAHWRERRANRRALRAERRMRGGGAFQDSARRAEGDAWGTGRFR